MLLLLLSTLSLGVYIVDLFLHPSLWNTIVFVGLLVLLGVIIYTNKKWSHSKGKRP